MAKQLIWSPPDEPTHDWPLFCGMGWEEIDWEPDNGTTWCQPEGGIDWDGFEGFGGGGGGGGSGGGSDWDDWDDWDDGGAGGGIELLLLGTENNEALSLDPPDCEATDLPPEEEAWCNGRPSNEREMAALEQMAMNILGRCQDLSGAWERARENIRIFTRTTQAFRGAGPVGGDWILISEEFLAVPLAAEVLLT